MRPSKFFFLDSAAREQIFLEKQARKTRKAADPWYRKKTNTKLYENYS